MILEASSLPIILFLSIRFFKSKSGGSIVIVNPHTNLVFNLSSNACKSFGLVSEAIIICLFDLCRLSNVLKNSSCVFSQLIPL